MDKIYRKIFCGTLLGYVQLHLCPGRSSSLCQVHPIHNLKLLPASTCVYYMCQHVCILHVLAHVFTTRASTCIYYTCQHVCIVHVLARVFITCARLLFKNMRPGGWPAQKSGPNGLLDFQSYIIEYAKGVDLLRRILKEKFLNHIFCPCSNHPDQYCLASPINFLADYSQRILTGCEEDPF